MISAVLSFLGLERRSTLAHPSPELLALFGAVPTASGVSVTPATAMQSPAVYACVKVLSESVAQLPLILYQRTANDGKERASDHPLYQVLHDQANGWTSAFEFRMDMQQALCLHGNAYAFINRVAGSIAELIQLPSETVTVDVDAVTMEPVYLVTGKDGAQRRYARRDIFHLRTLGNCYVGASPIRQAREAIGLGLTMERHAGRLFGAGARPSGVFKYAKTLSKEALERLKKSFAAAHSGADNSGNTLILEDGMDFAPQEFKSVDLQFLELRRHQVAEVARIFRVPLHMLQDLERTTHGNAETMGREFVALTLLPWLKLWEGAIRRSLLAPEERASHYAEFLSDDLARADLAARYTAYAQAVTNGILNPNEIRAAENRPPYEGGDQFRLPLNTEAPAPGGGKTQGSEDDADDAAA
jgi:HK97 family phage portal protein